MQGWGNSLALKWARYQQRRNGNYLHGAFAVYTFPNWLPCILLAYLPLSHQLTFWMTLLQSIKGIDFLLFTCFSTFCVTNPTSEWRPYFSIFLLLPIASAASRRIPVHVGTLPPIRTHRAAIVLSMMAGSRFDSKSPSKKFKKRSVIWAVVEFVSHQLTGIQLQSIFEFYPFCCRHSSHTWYRPVPADLRDPSQQKSLPSERRFRLGRFALFWHC